MNLDLINSRSLLMVSGGPDSVFLFYHYVQLKKNQGVEFDVVHFNHHLRGEESDREEIFVKELCARHDIFCHVVHLKFEKKSRIQELARKKRYEHAYVLQKEHQYTHLVTAHHRDDVLETLLMRRERGAGLKGLSGIREIQRVKNPLEPQNEFYLFRPLIAYSKKFILENLKNQGLDFCVDSSNLKTDYFRNRVRLDILAAWQNSEQKNEVLQSTRVLQAVDDYFTARVKFLSENYSSHVPLPVWQSWPEEIQFRFFAKKMQEHGFLHQVERRHFKEFSKAGARLKLNQAICTKNRSSVRFLTNSHN